MLNSHWNQPIITVGQPGGRILPVGEGMGATHAECIVVSPTRAAGINPIITVVEAIIIMPGPPGAQPGRRQGAVISVMRAAGLPPIRTLGCPLMMASGIGGWGRGVGTGAGGCIGA